MLNEGTKWSFPLWVKISIAVALIAAVAFLIVHLAGSGMAGMHG